MMSNNNKIDEHRPVGTAGNSSGRRMILVSAAGKAVLEEGLDPNRTVAAAGNGPAYLNTDQLTFFDYNFHSLKKSISSALLDVALLMANASQLKSIYLQGKCHPFYTGIMVCLSLSIVLQILVGFTLIFLSRININEPNQGRHWWAATLNTGVLVAVFALTIVNIFSVAFDNCESCTLCYPTCAPDATSVTAASGLAATTPPRLNTTSH